MKRLTKIQIHTPRYTKTRPYHKIDYQEMSLAITQDPETIQILKEHNPDVIAQKIIQLIQKHLDQRNPNKINPNKTKNKSFHLQKNRIL